MKIEFSSKQPIILIDGSYYVFYRYFATMRWFTFQKKDFSVESITENAEFVSSFIKHVQSDIKKICKKWKTDVNNIIFCTDCQRCKIWRNDIYKEYKASRTQNANFNGQIFTIFSEHIQSLGIKRIWFERLEADDIIYLLQSKLKKLASETKIVIITNDNDYLQLADKNIMIINMQSKDITQRGYKNPRSDLYVKALYGDKSDNIPKIANFLTKDKAYIISQMDDKMIRQWLQENNLQDKFNLNMQLISFDHIPTEYVNKFYDKNIIEVV
jgi:DNA polymerase-1